MMAFLVKAFFFDLIYSFLVGLMLIIVMLPSAVLSRSEQPGLLSHVLGIPIGMVLCAVQGVMIAAAVVVALKMDPGRWDPVWYAFGFLFSVPIAAGRSLSDPVQFRFAALGILSSEIAYVFACIWPVHIPPILGDTAIKLLL